MLYVLPHRSPPPATSKQLSAFGKNGRGERIDKYCVEIPLKQEAFEAEWAHVVPQNQLKVVVQFEHNNVLLEDHDFVDSDYDQQTQLKVVVQFEHNNVLLKDRDFVDSVYDAFMPLGDLHGCFRVVVDTMSGILGFYSPRVNDPWLQPEVLSQFTSEISWFKHFNGMPPTAGLHGITSLKKFCKQYIWTDEKNRVLHVDFIRTKNQKSRSITDLHHSVWFFANEHKNNKSYIGR